MPLRPRRDSVLRSGGRRREGDYMKMVAAGKDGVVGAAAGAGAPDDESWSAHGEKARGTRRDRGGGRGAKTRVREEGRPSSKERRETGPKKMQDESGEPRDQRERDFFTPPFFLERERKQPLLYTI